MNIKIIDETCTIKEKLEFNYSGEFEHVSPENIKLSVKKFIHEFPNHTDMVRNVTILKTMLRQGKEVNFILSRQEKGVQEVVKYNDGKLYSYEKTIEPENQAYRSFKYKYYFEDIDISIKKAHNDDPIDYSDINDIIERTEDNVDILKAIESHPMPQDGKILSEIYKNFYGKNPRYTDKFIHEEIRLMMIILREHIAGRMEKYTNFITDSNGLPHSFSLTDLILEMFPYDYVYETDVKLDEKFQKKVIELGNLTRNLIDENNLKESIINLEKELWQNIKSDYSFDASAKILKRLNKNRQL